MSLSNLILPVDDIDFTEWERETEAQQKVKPASHWTDDLIDEFSLDETANTHPRLPWGRLANQIALRPAEVSLWFGFNGHGKSLLQGQVMLSAAAQGERVCIGSFEMRPRKTLGRMCRQFHGVARPSPEQVREFVKWCEGKIWVYDQTGTVDPARVFAVIRYTRERLGVSHFVVDNLTKCIESDDDYVGQKAFVDKLTAIACGLGPHIHLVHHARKGKDETLPPRKMDALGASAITNLVDNVFIVWRNKVKAESSNPNPMDPDAVLIVDKQRHGTGWEGIQNLYYHAASQQYIEGGSHPMQMDSWPHTSYVSPRARAQAFAEMSHA